MTVLRSIHWGPLLLVYCALIFWLSSKSVLPTPMLFSNQDKLIHAAAYAVMALLCWHWLSAMRLGRIPAASISLLFCVLYGFSDEFHQSFVPGRDASILDWLADVTGAGLALLVMLRRIKPDPRQQTTGS